MTLAQVADEVQHRLIHIFARDHEGRRATNGGSVLQDSDPYWRDYVPFYEFFHADSGKGLGASHQTGWTGLIAYAIWSSGHAARLPRTPRTPRSYAKHFLDETVPETPAASAPQSEAEPDDFFSHGADQASASDVDPADL